jgi:hypothetical protein
MLAWNAADHYTSPAIKDRPAPTAKANVAQSVEQLIRNQ